MGDFQLVSPSIMFKLKPWIIFDGDNTLWDVESLYDCAREALCALLSTHEIDAKEVEEFQQKRDADLYVTYGYSACRFARSFEDTFWHFLPNAVAADLLHIRRLALRVFDQHAQLAEGLDELVEHLTAKYQLGIITAGERWVQERRLAHFHLKDKFNAINIVNCKDKTIFTMFCESNAVDPIQSWMIGDSIRSDIIPAREAGLNAVWLKTKNWSHIETSGHELPPGVPTIEHLLHLRSVLVPS